MENQNYIQEDETSIKELILTTKEWINFLVKRWVFIGIACFVGGAIGFYVHSSKQLTYKAKLVFVTSEGEDGGGLSKLSSLGSQFGINLGGGSSSAFGGENLLELMKSRRLVVETLFDSVTLKGKDTRLLEYYLSRFSEIDDDIEPVSFSNVKTFEQCNYRQDSLLNIIYTNLTKKALSVSNLDKDLAFKVVEFTDIDEQFAKVFVENLTKNVTEFYVETKTSQSKKNILMLQEKADSVERELSKNMVSAAVSRDRSVFSSNTQSLVNTTKKQMKAQMLGTIYAEVIKNLELSKTMAAHNEPLIQVIDSPRFPLEKEKSSLIKMLLAGLMGGLFISGGYLIGRELYRDIMAE
ncbi:lipopolysaccharide biosynthesis protein [Bacteroidia bacterium]|nr:lipopolysaccharide biosynthesis protein [Bacteroidia bacterium]